MSMRYPTLLLHQASMDRVEIVPATWHDAWALTELDRRCFSPVDAFGWLTYLILCLWPGVVRLKAVADGRLIGFIAAEPQRWRGRVTIVTLEVDPAWRRRGIGERLMREGEGRFDLPRFRLQVRKSNSPAIRLYQKLGYTIVDDLPRYYGDGVDGYLLEKARV